jgi:hypothetical protein
LIARPVYGSIEQAKSAESFIDSIGVNTHLNYFNTVYGDYHLIKGKLSALGVRHIRDGAYLTSDPDYNRFIYARYKDLNSALGIKGNLIVDPRGPNLGSIDSEKVRRISEMAGDSLGSFEGPNEYDLSGDGDWTNVLHAYQKSLYKAVKANDSTADVPVIGPSLTSKKAYAAAGDYSYIVDYGNVHNYYGSRHPGTSGWGADGYGSIDYAFWLSSMYAPNKPTMSTETGYHNVVSTTSGHDGAPESVAGKYIPRLYLEHFNRGFPKTYTYELIDLQPDPNVGTANANIQNHFGLLRNDGTEKPAFTALKNLIGLLEDPGPSFTPESLDYSLSGDTDNVHRTLLQKRDGRFYLVLWLEKEGFDPFSKQETPVAPQSVSLNLTKSASAKTYLPNNSTSATNTYTNQTQLDLEVPDHPLIVELTPSDSTTPPPPLVGLKVEGEAMTLVSGTGSRVYEANATPTDSTTNTFRKNTNGALEGKVTTDTSTTKIALRARGVRCRGTWPKARVSVDGVRVWTGAIKSRTYKVFGSTISAIGPGEHTIQVKYINEGACSARTLFVDHVALAP